MHLSDLWPHFPKRIAVIPESIWGAVIRDIITTTEQRYPVARLVLFPAVVQGEKAADSLLGRLKRSMPVAILIRSSSVVVGGIDRGSVAF